MLAYKPGPHGLYIPNPFARVGLFALTVVGLIALAGLELLVLRDQNERPQLFVFAAAVIIGLEVLVAVKHHYRSGIDDALLYAPRSSPSIIVIPSYL